MKPEEEREAPLRAETVSGDLAREVAREHAAIHEVIRRIEQALDRLFEHPAKPGERWELPDVTRSLREHLRGHFQLEESAGLLRSGALRDDPETRQTVERLLEEHRSFERRIARVIEEMNTGFVPARTVQRCFDDELRSLIADMARHEAVESELIQRIVRPEDDRTVD